MVEVGSLEWTVEAVGAAEAKRDAEQAAEGVKETADQAKEADSAVSGLTDVLEMAATGMLVMGGNSTALRAAVLALNGDIRQLAIRLTGMTGVYRRLVSVKGAAVAASERLTSAIQFLRGGITLLRSAVAGLVSGSAAKLLGLLSSLIVPAVLKAAGGIGGLATAIRGLGAAAKASAVANLGRLAAALGGISGASIAGAAALGALIGLFGVGVLEVTGFLDKVRELGKEAGDRVPASIRDGLLAAVAAIGGGPFVAAGAAIAGFVSGYLDGGLSEGISRAKSNWNEAMGVFEGAWNRTQKRLAAGFGDTDQRLSGFVARSRQKFRAWTRNSVRSATEWKNGVVAKVREGISEAIDAGEAYVDGFVSGIYDRMPSAAGAAQSLAATVRSYLPSSPADTGPLSDLDKVGPGMVAEISRTVEASVPRAESASRSLSSAMAPPPAPAPRSKGGSGGSGGSGGVTVVVENQRIEIGDQSLDVSSLGRREMERLAEMISDQQGNKLRRIIGN